ncbi:MAG: ATP-dependent Clp protease ATP-binding subunit [Lachnospiraceae bacterium]|nr:ATP-dependent Clp protease ATP-binding subunit [Lachnospiraceae bacterium]
MESYAYTKQARQVMRIAQNLVKERGLRVLGTEYILLGMIREKNGVAGQVLRRQSVQETTVLRVIDEMILPIPAADGAEAVALMPESEQVLERAAELAQQYESELVGTEHMLLSLLEHPDCAAAQILAVLTVNLDQMYGEILFAMGRSAEYASVKKMRTGKEGASAGIALLDQYSTDLTARAKAGELDPLVGREPELERMVQILSRRGKNNPCLIGEPGVGKTAIVEGLAQRIAQGIVPDFLQNRRVLSLDVAGLVAGTRYRGEFEERIKGILKETEETKDVLLFIDELHTIIGAGGAEGALDAANIMKPALSRGQIQVIGATTVREYRKHIEKDAALERRFQSILVEEPDPEETAAILLGLRSRYETHHGVVITDAGVRAAAELSARYISDRFLPDKAIDLMDEAASRVRLRGIPALEETAEPEKKLEALRQELEQAIAQLDLERASALRTELQNAQEEHEKAVKKQKQAHNRKKLTVGENDVAEVVAAWTHIPVKRLTESEFARLKRMETSLHKRVIAQDEAVKAVSRAVRRGRVGLKDPSRPIGSFLFLGPTGVGKTEISKALAQEVFGTEDAMIRVDMSEYMEKHSVSRMIGSPPGYVGYDEGGQLSEQVRRHPYSVILFDEIEKAHPDVFNILLQVLDDGHVTDAQGRKVDFKNTIIIMTSNAGAKSIVEPKKLGFAVTEDEQQDYERMKSNVMEEVRRLFRPEFLNRIDETIVFHALTKDHMKRIVSLMTDELQERCGKQMGIELVIRDSVKKHIVEQAYEPRYGARPLRRAIQTMLEDRLADEILAGKVKEWDAVTVSVRKGEIIFEV